MELLLVLSAVLLVRGPDATIPEIGPPGSATDSLHEPKAALSETTTYRIDPIGLLQAELPADWPIRLPAAPGAPPGARTC